MMMKYPVSNFVAIKPISNHVTHGKIENEHDYYGPQKSVTSSIVNPVYMSKATNRYPFENDNPNTDEAYGSCNPNTDERCEVDRGINRFKNRYHDHDTYSSADYEIFVVSSSDDTSNKRKVISETDVSTMSLNQTSRSSTTK